MRSCNGFNFRLPEGVLGVMGVVSPTTKCHQRCETHKNGVMWALPCGIASVVSSGGGRSPNLPGKRHVRALPVTEVALPTRSHDSEGTLVGNAKVRWAETARRSVNEHFGHVLNRRDLQ